MPSSKHLICIWFLFATALGLKTKYSIGAWRTGTREEVMAALRPLFEDYLNTEVGKHQIPPIQFELVGVDFDHVTDHVDDLIEADRIDFLYSSEGGVACCEAEQGWSPIATQRVLFEGMESVVDGSVLYALKSRGDLVNISDFKDKMVGVGAFYSSTTFHLGYELFMKSGVDLYSNTKQLIFYDTNYEKQFQDVLSGKIDGALAPSIWLHSHHKADLANLHMFDLANNPISELEPFPFPTSTNLVPQFGVLASEHVSWELKQKIVDALLRLNASHPAAISAGLAGFIGPSTYSVVRTMQQDMHVMIRGPHGPECVHGRNAEELWSNLLCQDGLVRNDLNATIGPCPGAWDSCPDHLMCLCRPCIPDPSVNFFRWQLVLGMCAALYGVGLVLSLAHLVSFSSCAFLCVPFKRLCRPRPTPSRRRGETPV